MYRMRIRTGDVVADIGEGSLRVIIGDGGVEFLATQINTYRICGLSSSNPDNSYISIEYAILPDAQGQVRVYESGVIKGRFGSYQIGDRFRVERIGSTIVYKKNNIVFYTSTIASSGNLLVDASIYTLGGTIADVNIIGGVLPSNNPPVAQDQDVTVIEGTAKAITLLVDCAIYTNGGKISDANLIGNNWTP